MNRHPISSAALSLFAVVMVACSPILARADNADNIVEFYSGDFSVTGGVAYYPGDGTAGTDVVYNSYSLNFDLLFSGNVTDFQETPYCGLGCPQYYTGDINSGTVQFSGFDQSGQHPNYNFSGIIEPGGTLSGEIVCDNQGCAWQDEISIAFQSTSGTNGWRSSGTLSWMDGNDGSGGGGFGNLNLLTQEASTPEPSSFLLFGSGVLGIGGWLRRQLR